MIEEEESDSLVDFYRDTLGAKSKEHRFYLFEPWDVQERDPRIFEEAVKDGFNLNNPELVAMVGQAPRLFQTGYIYDQSYIATMFASNQSGKSYAACVDALIVLTGEIPISMCHEPGVVTDVLREISDNNIKRWGRRCVKTGEILDHDVSQAKSPNHLWDCGFVTGVGIYPKAKLAPAGSKVWIVTYKQARDESWWPLLKGMVPPRMRDGARSNGGFDNREHIAYLSNNSQIHFITYEQGETRLEAAGTLQEEEKLWMVLFDEEPPTRKFWATVTQRVNIIRLVTTPYKGLSWTYDDILTKSPTDPDITIYHCTKFDCPYHTHAEIMRSKKTIPKWEIGARVYGDRKSVV